MSCIDQFNDQSTRRPPERRAAVFSFPAFYRVHSWAVFGMATLDPDGLDEILAHSLSAKDLGAIAWEALRASRYLEDSNEVRLVLEALKTNPSKRRLEEMKKRAGARSIKGLFRGSASVDLIWTEQIIELEPHRHLGGERWALFENRETIKFSETVSEEKLGIALISELEVSRNGSYEGT
ncbi:contact-dependent growth inhibition system immunity protein [Notoacmeibacter marinus]|uniref:contact-dependent growth inhibition system immunity protein n=1 Tax=Notoacmeibacter marinus TaxID=1876515 RepID=UPI000DF1D596|nr:contact-dependent growth inhibition system immunity protein [Notoacmeibacter marinus]